MPVRCSVTNCRNYYEYDPSVTLHPFPTDKVLKKIWLEKINCIELLRLSDMKIKTQMVCSEHFYVNQFRTPNKEKLRANAIPRIFFIHDTNTADSCNTNAETISSIISELPLESEDPNTVFHITPMQESDNSPVKYKVEIVEFKSDLRIAKNGHDTAQNTKDLIDILDERSIELEEASASDYDDDDERPVDIAKVCRLCLSGRNLVALSADGHGYIDKIKKLTAIELVGAPMQICERCTRKIDDMCTYIEKCRNVDAYLRNKMSMSISEHSYQKSEAEDVEFLNPVDMELDENGEQIIYLDVDHLEGAEIEEIEYQLEPVKLEEPSDETQDIKDMIEQYETEELKDEYKHIDDYELLMETDTDEGPEIDRAKYECKMCYTKMKTIADMEAHRKNNADCGQTKSYECKICKGLFLTYTELHEHRDRMKHTLTYKKKKCQVCLKPVARQHLGIHMRTHTKETPYCCEFCGLLFTVAGNLKRHLIVKHEGLKPFKCEICGKCYTAKHVLKDHMHTHTGQKPYVCSYCGKGYSQQGSLNLHLRTHSKLYAAERSQDESEEKPFEPGHKCEVCHQVFKRRGALDYHMSSHMDRKYKCSECGRMFGHPGDLMEHFRVHKKEKPFSCEFCGKKFGFSSALKIHMVTHTGERPFKCPTCDMSFTQRSHVRTHMRTHDGERPYTCHLCGKSFALNGNLTVHMRIHTGEQPFRCGVCDRGFYDSSSMKKHQKTHSVIE